MCTSERHDAIKTDDAIWLTLEPEGYQPTYDEPGQPTHLELKKCDQCDSTLSRLLSLEFMDEEPTVPCVHKTLQQLNSEWRAQLGGFFIGDRVRVWTGEFGTISYVRDGWYGVRLDGEGRVDEWQSSQVYAP